jgi:hypothetical protein
MIRPTDAEKKRLVRAEGWRKIPETYDGYTWTKDWGIIYLSPKPVNPRNLAIFTPGKYL